MPELLHLALASHELRQPPSHGALQPRAQRTQPGHFVNVDRLADAFNFGRAKTIKEEVALTELSDLFRRRDRTYWRQHLHPRREVGSMPNRRVLGMRLAGLDRTHHHLTCIHADPRLQRQPAFLPHAVRIALQLFLQPERRIQGPLWMVLMCDW